MKHPEPEVAKQDLPVKCSRCKCRIDKGDRYRVISWPSGFDYEHADCKQTSMREHTASKVKHDDGHEEVPF